MLNKYWWC